MVSSLTSPSPVSVSARLSPWSSRAPFSNGNALNSDRCSKLEMKKEIALASFSLKRILQGLDRQCTSLGSVQERRLNPMHVLCSSSSTSSSPPAPVSSREDESSSSFVLLNHHTAADVGDVARHQALTEVDDGPEVLIECRDVYKAFGEKQILKGASFKARLLLMPVVVNAGPAKGPIQRQS
jgi:hypothetical protein